MAIGLGLGALAGVLDVIPMLVQKLPWAADISAFTLWVAVGFILSTSELRLWSPLKGVVLAFVVLAPSAVIIGFAQPFSLIPISVMTLVLGALLGFGVENLAKTGSRGR